MRLINTATLKFEELEDVQYKSYAILSHRWGRSEISYSDYLDKRTHAGPGYAKIRNFCRLAKDNGFEWTWVDTCCIDKKSSAELSEAINSMYNWYKYSDVCYVYLVDVPSASDADAESRMKAFRESQWWTRGWTLQELLAPNYVEFYDCEWGKVGSKNNLLDTITEITGVSSLYLRKPWSISDASVAMRMSWASRRDTTKSEDIAYSLMGIFKVNMPLLYGEGGRKAYLRLQQEIIKDTDDNSIFAWEDSHPHTHRLSMLAPGPWCFEKSRTVSSITNLHKPPWKQKPFSITNIGLKIRFPSSPAEQGSRYLLLHCCAGETCNRCPPSMSHEKAGVPNSPEIHQWLAVKLEPYSDALWRRISPELLTMDPKQFAVDEEAIYVV
jgi:hypothetical protein